MSCEIEKLLRPGLEAVFGKVAEYSDSWREIYFKDGVDTSSSSSSYYDLYYPGCEAIRILEELEPLMASITSVDELKGEIRRILNEYIEDE